MSDTTSQSTSGPSPRQTSRMGDGAGFLVDALRARPVARRILSGLSVVLAVIALGMLAYPFTTNLYQGRLQTKLGIQLKTNATKQAYQAGQTPEGDALTRIVIPSIDVNTVVVEGTGAYGPDDRQLAKALDLLKERVRVPAPAP